MRRKIAIVLLSIGTVGGFAWGVHGMGHHRHRHAAMAEACVDAALAVRDGSGPTPGETEADSHWRWEHRVRQLCADAARRRAG